MAGAEVRGGGNKQEAEAMEKCEGQELFKEVEALDGGGGNEVNEGKEDTRAVEKKEALEESGSRDAGGREVRGDQDKTRDDLHISNITISECMYYKLVSIVCLLVCLQQPGSNMLIL